MINYIQLTTDVFNGDEDPIKGLIEIKKLYDDVKQCYESIYVQAVEEATKYEKTFELHGAKIEQRNGGASHSYKHIPDWVEAKAILTAIETRAKEANKAIASGMVVFSEKDGTEVEPSKVTYRKDSIIIKLEA